MNTHKTYFSKDEHCLDHLLLLANLAFAKSLSLISDDSLEALEERRCKKNRECESKKASGEIVYGLTHYSKRAYAEYEMLSFRLLFASGADAIRAHFSYAPVSYEDKQSYYRNHPQLFTRAAGDSFTFEEVENIIEKKIREKEYDAHVQNILHQLKARK